MKRHFLTAVALTIATVAIAPAVSAAEFETTNLHQRRHEFLDRTSAKSIDDIQSARLEHLNTRSKAVNDIQTTRLDSLDSRSKGNVHSLRLEQLDTQNKAIDDVHATRLDELNSRSKAIVR